MGALYDVRLGALYVQLSRIYGAHEPHVTAERVEGGPCPHCGHGTAEPKAAQVCGGAAPNDVCIELDNALYGAIEAAFPLDEDDVRALLADTREAWTWGAEGGQESVLEYAAEAFRTNAYERLVGDCLVTDPFEAAEP